MEECRRLSATKYWDRELGWKIYSIRCTRARHGGHHERHCRLRDPYPIWRYLPQFRILRLWFRPLIVSLTLPSHLCGDPRLHRSGRGRAYSSADRDTCSLPRPSQHDGLASSRRQRDQRGLLRRIDLKVHTQHHRLDATKYPATGKLDHRERHQGRLRLRRARKCRYHARQHRL